MELTNLFIAVIVYIGLVFGFLLKKVVKEEVKQGRKGIIIIKNLLLTAIAFIVFFKLVSPDLLILLSLVLFTLLTSFSEDIIKKEWVVYAVLAGFFYMVIKNVSTFYIVSSLMFLYGLVSGSLVSKKQVIISSCFVFISLIFMFLL